MLYVKKEVTICGKKREVEEPDLKDIGRWLGACLLLLMTYHGLTI